MPVDTYALAGRSEPSLNLAGMRMPRKRMSERASRSNLRSRAPSPCVPALNFAPEGQAIGSERLTLQAGTNTVTVRAKIESPGATLVEGTLTAAAEELVDLLARFRYKSQGHC